MKPQLSKRKRWEKNIFWTLILLFAIAFVAKFASPRILRLYIEAGIGNCQKIPVLCITPGKEIVISEVNKEYIRELIPYSFPEIGISLPAGFTGIKERITKVYYKKGNRKHTGSVIYLLYKKPNFFVDLFPQLKKQGITNDYEFIKYMMYAAPNNIHNLRDAFFVIIKSIFTPDLGEQKNVQMVEFSGADKKGFIAYNFSHPENYFDCNVFNRAGDFFKLYIKDKEESLDLDKVMAIISTVNRAE